MAGVWLNAGCELFLGDIDPAWPLLLKPLTGVVHIKHVMDCHSFRGLPDLYNRAVVSIGPAVSIMRLAFLLLMQERLRGNFTSGADETPASRRRRLPEEIWTGSVPAERAPCPTCAITRQ